MKKIYAILLVLSMMLGLYACANANAGDNKEPDNNEIATPETQKELVIAMESEPTTLNPYDHAALTSGYMNKMTYNKLFRIDLDTLESTPELVSEYENIDETTWVFTIHDNVYFHDGSHMTAEDVKASLAYARNFTASNKYTAFWADVEVTGEYTLKITTNTPYALILNDLAANGNTIVPKHLIEAGNDFNQNPIGSGPYKYIQWNLGDSVTFEMNENYFDKDHQPTIERITWRIIPEGASRTIALETGEVHLVIDVDTTDIARIGESDNLSVIERPGTRINFMGINTERAPFDNENFRKAITAAIDKEAVLTVAMNGKGSLAMSPNPSVFRGASDENTIPYDVEAAREYLELSGIDPETVVINCIAYTDVTRRTAEVVQSYLLEIGIDMEIENMDFAAYLSAMLDGHFDAVIGGYTSGDMLSYMKGLWHSSSIGASNVPRLNDPELDSLIDLAMTQLDSAERTKTLEQISAIINDKCPMISLYTSSVIRAYSNELGGAAVSASGEMLYQDLYWVE